MQNPFLIVTFPMYMSIKKQDCSLEKVGNPVFLAYFKPNTATG